jgi:tetratricopeptide (TPR) repeat protein
MKYPKVKSSESMLDAMLGEASWLLSHAEALADYGRKEEALAELARAAGCEEWVACWLDATGREQEAGVHRVSAASCYEQLGEYAQAVTLLRAALSAPLPDDYRHKVEKQVARCLRQAQKELRRTPLCVMHKPVEADLSEQAAASR